MAGDNQRGGLRHAGDVAAGLVTALVIVALSGSYALLIFSGPLASVAGLGLYVSLITALVAGLFAALFSSQPLLLSIPQDRIAPILGFLAASLAATIPADAPPGTLVASVLVAVAFSAIGTGLFLWLLGTLRLGNFVRFIPYPVIGGFLAGSGWLLATGSVKAMTGIPLNFETAPTLLLEGGILPWVPSGVFGAALFVLQLRVRHWAVLPAFLLGGMALTFALLALWGMDLEAAREAGWLIPTLAMREPLPFSPLEIGGRSSWVAILAQAGTFLAIAITTVVSILLNSSAAEAETASEVDLNRELRVSGMANMVAGTLGGMPGFSSLSLSKLAVEAGSRTRWAAIVSALACGGVLAINPGIVGFAPKFILGGLLFFLGLRFLHEWLVQSFSRLPRMDFATILLILVVISVFGYLQGVMAGLLTATILFVVNYSRVQVVAQALSGSQQRSNVDRPIPHQRLLTERGDALEIFKLQGFLFFGSANNVLSQIRERLQRRDLKKLRFVVLDLRRVHGIDSSAVLAMRKLRLHAEMDGFTLIFCHASKELQDHLARAGFPIEAGTHFRIDPDRDHALEWCEERLLDEAKEQGNAHNTAAALWEAAGLPFKSLDPYLEQIDVQAGQTLIEQGRAAEELYLLDRGRVTVVLRLQDGQTVRLRSITAGSVIGELGVFLQEPRSASVVADEPSVLHRLTRAAMEKLARENPALADAFHRFIIRLLAERLTHANRALQHLLE